MSTVSISTAYDLTLVRCERATRIIAILLLAATCFMNVQAGQACKDRSTRNANILSSVICLTALLCYLDIHFRFSGVSVCNIRHIDWGITCPLLLVEMALLLGVPLADWRVIIAMLASIAMIIVGSGSSSSLVCLCYGFLFLLIVAAQVFFMIRGECSQQATKTKSHKPKIVVVFFSFWFLYGILASVLLWKPTANLFVSSGYNILDVCSKAFFGLLIAALGLGITENLANQN